MVEHIILNRAPTERSSGRRVQVFEVCPHCGEDFEIRDGKWYKDPIDPNCKYLICKLCNENLVTATSGS